jgi:RimJ/RimL family protein N-acetyltransferase
MKLATITQLAVVWNIFKQHKKVFPHLRTDYLKRQIVVKNVIFDEGVVIVNNEYKRKVKLNKKVFEKGTYIIHQIVNSVQGNGKASKVLNKFLNSLTNVRKCILTVRKSNLTARKFYEKNGFKKVDTISWSNKTIAGIVYERIINDNCNEAVLCQN